MGILYTKLITGQNKNLIILFHIFFNLGEETVYLYRNIIKNSLNKNKVILFHIFFNLREGMVCFCIQSVV